MIYSDHTKRLTFLIPCWKVKVILAITSLGSVRSPQLLTSPLDILHFHSYSVINHLSTDLVHGHNVVIGHIILITSVIELDIALSVVGGVDVDSTIERVGRRVGNVDIGD
jgi:hypothetical protein